MNTTPIITGIAASAGVGSGTVRVILSRNDFPLMQEGDVLVCPMTNPEWVVVMSKASAIVTDEGGKMSHAAIVCRELGLPAVVGTGAATSTLVDGMNISVNGTEGAVYDV